MGTIGVGEIQWQQFRLLSDGFNILDLAHFSGGLLFLPSLGFL